MSLVIAIVGITLGFVIDNAIVLQRIESKIDSYRDDFQMSHILQSLRKLRKENNTIILTEI